MRFPEGSLVRLVRADDGWDGVGTIGIVLENPEDEDDVEDEEFPTVAWRRDPVKEAEFIARWGSTHFHEAYPASCLESVDERPTPEDVRQFESYCYWCLGTGESRRGPCNRCHPNGTLVLRSDR